MTNRINYQNELEKILQNNRQDEIVPSILLHACCAPCSSYCLEYLSEYFNITVFFYNPNISEQEEYEKRALELRRFIDEKEFANRVEYIYGEYEPEHFYSAVRGFEKCEEGYERCFLCYELRLRKTAVLASEGKFDYFCTTLTISPLKNAQKINEIGFALQKEYDITWLPSDFKKKSGYLRSIELSKEYKLYRQNYCGCVFSQIK